MRYLEDFAVGFIQAEQALDAGNDAAGERVGGIIHAFGKDAVKNINAAMGDRRA